MSHLLIFGNNFRINCRSEKSAALAAFFPHNYTARVVALDYVNICKGSKKISRKHFSSSYNFISIFAHFLSYYTKYKNYKSFRRIKNTFFIFFYRLSNVKVCCVVECEFDDLG